MSIPAATARTTGPARERRGARLRGLQYLGYGAGDAANNLAFSMTSMFLLLYYTDVVGITATAVGTLFLIVRVFDGFADLFAGRVVDRLRHTAAPAETALRRAGESVRQTLDFRS